MAARLIILGAFLVAAVALLIYGAVWLYRTHVTTDLEHAKLDHERKLTREERDYDTLLADLDDDWLDEELATGDDHDREGKR